MTWSIGLNKPQLIADLSEVLAAMPVQEDKNLDLGQIRCFLDMVNCELTNVQINGSEAIAFVKSPTEFSSIYFRKATTGWQAQLRPTLQ